MDYKKLIADSFASLASASIKADEKDEGTYHFKPFAGIPEEVIFSFGEASDSEKISIELVCPDFAFGLLNDYTVEREVLVMIYKFYQASAMLLGFTPYEDSSLMTLDEESQKIVITRSEEIRKDGKEIAIILFDFIHYLQNLRGMFSDIMYKVLKEAEDEEDEYYDDEDEDEEEEYDEEEYEDSILHFVPKGPTGGDK